MLSTSCVYLPRQVSPNLFEVRIIAATTISVRQSRLQLPFEYLTRVFCEDTPDSLVLKPTISVGGPPHQTTYTHSGVAVLGALTLAQRLSVSRKQLTNQSSRLFIERLTIFLRSSGILRLPRIVTATVSARRSEHGGNKEDASCSCFFILLPSFGLHFLPLRP